MHYSKYIMYISLSVIGFGLGFFVSNFDNNGLKKIIISNDKVIDAANKEIQELKKQNAKINIENLNIRIDLLKAESQKNHIYKQLIDCEVRYY